MALFDRIRKKTSIPEVEAVQLSPEVLRNQLLKSVANGDTSRFNRLITANRATIEQAFESWMKVPKDLPDDQAAMDRYVQTMILIGQTFQQQFGDGRLLQRMTGDTQNNPIVRWEQGLALAAQLQADLDYDKAKEVLSNLLIDMRDLQIRGRFSHKAVAHGHLAKCLFASGDIDGAMAQLEQAFDASRDQDDGEGVGAALQGLYDIHRYLNDPEKAAEAADNYVAHAESLGQPENAAQWRRLSRIVRAGEPLNRVVVSIDGGDYIEFDEVKTFEGKALKFAFLRNRPNLALCEALVARGMSLARIGKYDEAIVDFRAAAKVDRFDPQPHFQEAVTLMHLGHASDAVAAFDATEELAPGWFNARAERWLAAEVAAGRVDQSVFEALRTAELPEDEFSWAEKLQLAEATHETSPQVPALGLYRAQCLMRLDRQAAAADAFAQALSIASEPDIRTQILFEMHRVLDDNSGEQQRLLTEAAALNGNLIAGAMARMTLRYFI